MVWEGNGAIEEESDDESAIASRRKSALNAHKATPDLNEESEDEKSSEDEYTEMRADQGQVCRLDSFFLSTWAHIRLLRCSATDVYAVFPLHQIQNHLMNRPNGVLGVPKSPHLLRLVLLAN